MSTFRIISTSTRSARPRALAPLRRPYSTVQSTPQKADSSHLLAGLAGGGLVLGAIYGYYHYSGTAAVVNTARQTISAAGNVKDKVVGATPSPKEALHLIKSLAKPYVAAFPGGSQALDAGFNTAEGLLEKHGDEVVEILKKSAGEVQAAIGEGKEGGEKVLKALQGMVSRVGDLGMDQVQKVLDSNPEWKDAVGSSFEDFKKLGEKHGPEASRIATSLYTSAFALAASPSADSLSKFQSLLKEKTAELSKLAQKSSSDAWSAAQKAAGPALEKMPDVQKLVDEKLKDLQDVVGEDNVDVIKSLYGDLSKIGSSKKSPQEMTQEAKKAIESRLGTFDEIKKKSLSKGSEVAGKSGDKVMEWASAVPGLAGISKLLDSDELKELKELADKHGSEVEKLLQSSVEDIKAVLHKKLEEAKKVGANAAEDAKKGAKDVKKEVQK